MIDNDVQDKPKVLYVDDDTNFIELFYLNFGRSLDIKSSVGGSSALGELKSSTYDLVITDFDMPEMNGIELLENIKIHHPHVPVIFYTGQGNEEIAREAFIKGVSDYFTKDIFSLAHKEKLINSIKNIIERKKAEKLLAQSEEKYKSLVENVPGIVFQCLNDKHWTMTFISDAVEEMTGYPASDFIYNKVRTFNSIIHPDDRQRMFDFIRTQLELNKPCSLEYRIIDSQGKEHHVYEKAREIKWKKDDSLHIEGVIVEMIK